MWEQVLPGLRIKIFMTVVLGVAYPLLMTGISQAIFPKQSNGSLITAGDQVIGSELIGQGFSKPEYFHPRPSAAGESGYDAAASSGSNLGPTSAKLAARVAETAARLRAGNPGAPRVLPADIATASASGLDPHVSAAAASMQVARVAAARGIDEQAVLALVRQFVEPRVLGLLGEPRVNVLQLNLALDEKLPAKQR